VSAVACLLYIFLQIKPIFFSNRIILTGSFTHGEAQIRILQASMGRFNKHPTPKRNSSGLGAALTASKKREARTPIDVDAQFKFRHVHSTCEAAEVDDGLKSIVDRNDLDELMARARLADRNFEVERGSAAHIVSSDAQAKPVVTATPEAKAAMAARAKLLRIPRRPAFAPTTTPEEFDAAERSAFLDWRRGLAELEEDSRLVLTPFERNLDIWRQLWRVVERSDVIAQIVDARQPLLFLSQDLVRYIAEVSRRMQHAKSTVVIVNKADFLPLKVREAWHRFFARAGLPVLFFSAVAQKEALEAQDSEGNFVTEPAIDSPLPPRRPAAEISSPKLLSRMELLDALAGLRPDAPEGQEPATTATLGLVGYPNVGKSSVVNVLMHHTRNRVSVAATPGKTKHFQTLKVTAALTVADCPGLVFPSFATTRAAMVCAGILPIDEMRDFRTPVQLVCNRIPRSVLERVYGITIPEPSLDEVGRPPHAAELLTAHALARGFRAQQGVPDQSRSARQVLKDYLSGKLLFVTMPPGSPTSKPVAAAPVAAPSSQEAEAPVAVDGSLGD
jgi:large subunit GTPase 1